MLWLFTTTKATKCLFDCNHQCFTKALPSNNLRTSMLFICSIKLKVSFRDQTILSLFTCSRLPIIISSLFHKRIRGTILKRACLLAPCSGLCYTRQKSELFFAAQVLPRMSFCVSMGQVSKGRASRGSFACHGTPVIVTNVASLNSCLM